MNRIVKKAYAKINLSLDVLRKREDGYHELKMIMQTIDLHDTVTVEKAEEGIILECDSRLVPNDSRNIAWKAACAMMEAYGIKGGVRINIVKRIPVAAGLAGGSSDAAAVLRGMNDLFRIGAGADELRKIGRKLGADVPYCVSGGTKLAEGIGDKLTDLPGFSGVDIVLVKPPIEVSTAWVYGNLDISRIGDLDRPDTDKITAAIGRRDVKTVAGEMKNVLETVTIKEYESVQLAKEKLREAGALGSLMSGSGPTVFGIFPDEKKAMAAYGKLAGDKNLQCFYAKTYDFAYDKD